MTYAPTWLARHEIITAHNYVLVTKLQKALDKCRSVPFSLKAERDGAIAMLRAALGDPKEVTMTERFPETGRYVNVSSGPVADILDRLLMSLDSGERFMDREQASASTSKYSSIDGAKLTWIKLTQKLVGIFAMAVQSSTVYGIFNRATFESWYSLTWV